MLKVIILESLFLLIFKNRTKFFIRLVIRYASSLKLLLPSGFILLEKNFIKHCHQKLSLYCVIYLQQKMDNCTIYESFSMRISIITNLMNIFCFNSLSLSCSISDIKYKNNFFSNSDKPLNFNSIVP